MTAYEDAVQRYFTAWNAATPEELAKAVAAAFTDGATYTDPLASVRGHDELVAVISGAHQQFPGFEFKLTGAPEGHHDIVRFSWDLVSTADGSAPVAGSDVVTLDDDGRITSVSGFLDRVPGA
ncbi:nuclear transport factor 2 family protein [Streptomyces sp. NBC_00841]|uniref:nuclear transport factor 2 family protein n=1 Tax=unclassified Streptomyces TaxID=2593676 RepID=UPI002253EED8|nr:MULTISPECIES: nuclear transport factor 2 family protein [unclassified Streptomyces]MCX4531689.1 nuclear transport factor 2 family protein [Streptomyces sp. NBC_01669]WSA02743.1 nuclear transport factor 2 family protein [Streptomyces sp. NBC_00841]